MRKQLNIYKDFHYLSPLNAVK